LRQRFFFQNLKAQLETFYSLHHNLLLQAYGI
jgi:hypothetical protein